MTEKTKNVGEGGNLGVPRDRYGPPPESPLFSSPLSLAHFASDLRRVQKPAKMSQPSHNSAEPQSELEKAQQNVAALLLKEQEKKDKKKRAAEAATAQKDGKKQKKTQSEAGAAGGAGQEPKIPKVSTICCIALPPIQRLNSGTVAFFHYS